MLQRVLMIETAVRYEMVAKESSVQGWHVQPGGCWRQQTYSRRDAWGCNRRCKRRLRSPANNDHEPQRHEAGDVRSEQFGRGWKTQRDAVAQRLRPKTSETPVDSAGSFRELLPDALTWPVRLSVQDASLSSWKGGFDSRTGHSITDQVVELGDTRHSDRRAARHGSSTLPLVTEHVGGRHLID